MLKTRLILIAITAVVVLLIFLLPKVVVETENELSSDTAQATQPVTAAHGEISQSLRQNITETRRKFASEGQNEKSSIFADSLRSLYTKAEQFDSAAWYAEKSAAFLKNTESYLKAGNSYYDAYMYAVDQQKQRQMAEKAREFLGKVLEADPKNSEAKVKVAMTYMSSGGPMQGVRMLREVVADDPKNELALFNLGMLSVQSRQHEKAVEWFTKLVEVNPKHIQGQLFLGLALANSGHKKEAREQLEKVKQMDKDPQVQATVDSYLKELK